MLLDEIIFNKRQEVTALKLQQSKLNLAKLVKKLPKTRKFKQIFKKGQLALIAEIKKASPSAGVIKKQYNPINLAKVYARAGAAAISVLTDNKFFKGDLGHLGLVHKAVNLPILRKDFIIDESQVYEARIAGADAVLLIVRILTDSQLVNLLALVRKLGMQSLVEAHNADEVKRALKTEARIIGINNRDLDTLKVNLDTTVNLLNQFPKLRGRIVVSESGIKTREDIQRLKEAGVNGVLVGESILTSQEAKAKVKELLAQGWLGLWQVAILLGGYGKRA